MKRLIRANTYYNDIPTLEIEIDIYSFKLIRVAYLQELIDKDGNIIDQKAYEQYMEFIEQFESYLKTLNIADLKSHQSNKSASEYYIFTVLDENNNPICSVKCVIRISDHIHNGKKYRGKNVVDARMSRDTIRGVVVTTYQFITPDFVSYKDCLRTIKRTIETYQNEVLEDYGVEKE